MISPIFCKLSFAAVEDVFSRVGILDRFTKGQIRHLSAHISWQVCKLFKDNWFAETVFPSTIYAKKNGTLWK